MNLSPLEIAARNYFANVSGVINPTDVAAAFDNALVRSMAEDTVSDLLEGPFGSLDLTLVENEELSEADRLADAMSELLGMEVVVLRL